MSFKTIGLGLVLIFVIIFTGVEYVEFAIIQSPSVNESVFRSLIYFLPIAVGIPIALRVRGGGEAIEESLTRNTLDNPTISCHGEGCWKRFHLEEAGYNPEPHPDNITLRRVYRNCPFCGMVIESIPPIVVKADRWSRRLPAEILQNVRENG